jgi:TatD DNase family protein
LYFDSHAHFGEDFRSQLDRACAANLAGLLAVGGGHELNAFAAAAARHAPGFAHLAIGWDRSHAQKLSPEAAAEALVAESELCHEAGIPLSAVGEIGLDYHYEGESAAKQRDLFERQVALAAQWRLPVVVHSREADADTLAILKSAGSRELSSQGRLGVLHCYTGDEHFAESLMELGMCISFSGIVTFRNADPLRAVAKTIPWERLLIETDCPYLTPVPLRGRPNEPAYVPHVAACLAAVRAVEQEEVALRTLQTATHLFNVPRGTRSAK